ncbi:hypothetical protein HNR40_009235 [Nonomuraea endophytica]|uniref:Uncharacterized protein n=2 Tax=Nonomuraea endophytica TaxID=714136 RepID=A0A7W8ACU0_9ACTN|nr:hypothetical protein [Nonomuraea endophytica]
MEQDDADDSPSDAQARLDLYSYATADKHAHEYIALMRLFTDTILTDLSAAEAAALDAHAVGAHRSEHQRNNIEPSMNLQGHWHRGSQPLSVRCELVPLLSLRLVG